MQGRAQLAFNRNFRYIFRAQKLIYLVWRCRMTSLSGSSGKKEDPNYSAKPVIAQTFKADKTFSNAMNDAGLSKKAYSALFDKMKGA